MSKRAPTLSLRGLKPTNRTSFSRKKIKKKKNPSKKKRKKATKKKKIFFAFFFGFWREACGDGERFFCSSLFPSSLKLVQFQVIFPGLMVFIRVLRVLGL